MVNSKWSITRLLLIFGLIFLFSLNTQEFTLLPDPQSHGMEGEYFPLVPVSFSNGISYIDYDMLSLAVGGEPNLNLENFTRLVENYFIPANIRLIGLSIGWEEHANTSFSNIPFYIWVDEFLTVTDEYGIDVFFVFNPWKKTGCNYSWWVDFSADKPELQALLKNFQSDTNEPVLLIADSPLIQEQLKEDLKQLYSYYGWHTSWKGIAFKGPDGITPFVLFDDLSRKIITNNYTLNNFLNSIFYSREAIASGTHTDGTSCKLWQQFRENKELLEFSSGYAQRSYPQDLSGNRMIAMVFKASKSINGFKVSWYGRRVNASRGLTLELYNMDANYLSINASPAETVKIPTEQIRTQIGWQAFAEFESRLNEGEIYSIVFRIDDGEGSDKYEVYYRNWRVDDSIFLVSSSSGRQLNWQFKGSAIIWIKDTYDADYMIYPFQDRGIIRNDKSDVRQIFQSPRKIRFNTIFLSVSDRPYDENIATVKVVRNSDGEVIAKGSINPSYTKGMYWWLPIPLESEAVLEERENYTLIVERMSVGEGWQIHYIVTDPAAAGPQGNSKMLLFKLAYIEPIIINFMKIGPPGRAGPEAGWPGAEYETWWAQRYNVSRTAPLVRVEVNIEKYGSPGDLIVRLREDDGTGLAPAKEDIEAVRIPVGDIPTGRVWLNITGWNTTLKAGKMYWIILSTDAAPEGNGYWPWKIEYAYQFLIKRSDDAGMSWVRPHEPAELYINLFTSDEEFVVEPEDIVGETYVTDRKQVAQSFSLSNDTYVNGILIFLSRSPSDQNGLLIAEIRIDNGFDSPSTMVLTSGRIRMVENWVTFNGLQLVEFEYPYFLKAGVKYWLVIKGDSSTRVEPLVFAFHYPELSYGGTQLKVKITSDGGQNWYLPENRETDLLFGLVKAPCNPRFFTTQELVEDIEKYHIHNAYEEPAHGLNVYLNVQISNLQKTLVQWFESYTGRKWFSLDFNHPSVLEEARSLRESFCILKVNNSSEVGEMITRFPGMAIIPELDVTEEKLPRVEMYYKMILPNCPSPFMLFNLEDIRVLEKTFKTNISSFWNVTKLMRYFGDYYGRSADTIRVLLIGNRDAQILAEYFLSTTNVTLARIDKDQNLSRFGYFETFNVIVLASDKYSADQLTQDARQRIKEFVKRGGGLVVMFNWPEWIDEIVGFKFTSERVAPGLISYADLNHPILVAYTSIDWYNAYWSANKIIQIGENATFIVKDSNGQPWISYNPYGSGVAILCGAPSDNINEFKYDYLTILTNAIFYAAKKDNTLPAIWYGDSLKEKSLSDYIEYTISGKPGGPLLLWLTTNNNETRIEINLNANFFNIDTDGWVALDAVSWLPVGMGNGTEICIKIQSGTWLPIYIMNDTQDFHILYSNLLIKAQKIYPNQALYEICSDLEQDVWLIVRSTVVPREIRVEANPIRSASGLSTLYKLGEGSYFYDEKNRLTYIGFIAKEKDTTVRIIREETRSAFYMVDENKQLIYALLVLSLVLVELYVLNRAKSRVGGIKEKM
ncbi:MAG: hypothetical protein QW797_06405 [Thermoproteota archaeon]